MSSYGSLDTKISEIYVCNTSRDIIRYFSTVASEDPVYAYSNIIYDELKASKYRNFIKSSQIQVSAKIIMYTCQQNSENSRSASIIFKRQCYLYENVIFHDSRSCGR